MVAFPVAAGQRITAAVLNHAYSISDTTSTTLTAAAYNDLSSVYTIPANDAATGVAYRLSAYGNGTTGSNARTAQFACQFGGSVVGVAPTIGSTAMGTSLAFRWKMTLLLTPISIGSSATWNGSIEGCVTFASGNVVPGNNANFTVPIAGGNSAPYSQDSTIPNDFSVWFQWDSTSGSPTITCVGTTFERLG